MDNIFFKYIKKRKFILYFLTPLLLLTFSLARAQTITNSPYTRYGIGELKRNGFAINSAIGGIGSGLSLPYNINFINPASYSAIRLTTFETGISGNLLNLQTHKIYEKNGNVSFDYLAFAFPVSKKWGTSLGILPLSNVGYKISDKQNIPEIDTAHLQYSGSGGVNLFYLGNAFKLTKKVSVGFNASYLFGSISKSKSVEFDTTNIFNTQTTNTITSGDFHFNYGMQFATGLKNNYSLTLGLNGSFPTKIKALRTIFSERYIINNVYRDTIQNTSETGNWLFPATISTGISLKKTDKFLAGMDFTFQNWSKFSSFGENDSLKNSFIISTGAEYTPDPNAINKYWQLVQYRIGMYYTSTYLELANTPINGFGLTMGVGLPVKKTKSAINLSFDVGQKGTLKNNLIKELYGCFKLNFAINDKWFIKRKFD